MSFPLSPTNGQTAVLNGITYSYSSANALWTRVTGAVPNTIKSTSSANSPANPNIGDIWYNTTTDATYRYTSDGVTSYWLDITGASTTLTTGAASALVVSQPTYAVNFASSYVSIPYIAGLELSTTSAFTIEAWVNLTANTAGTSVIIGTRNNGAAGWEFRLSATRTIQFYYTGGSSINSTDTLNLGVWYHVAFVRNAGTVYIFINGALSTTATGFANGTAAANPIVVAAQTGISNAYFNGSISNLRVLSGTALYTAAFAVPSAPLTAITNTQLLTCQNVPVVDASTNNAAVTNVGGASLAIYAAPTVSNTGFAYPTWTTASRPALPSAGTSGYNTTLSGVEIYNGTAWAMISGGPAFLAGINSSTDATIAINTAIPANITQYNIASGYNTTTYRFTAPIAGVYKFTVGIYFTNSGSQTQNMQVGLRKNGSFQSGGSDAYATINVQPNAFASGTNQSVLTADFLLSVGDFIDVSPRVNSLRHYQGHYWFQGHLIG